MGPLQIGIPTLRLNGSVTSLGQLAPPVLAAGVVIVTVAVTVCAVFLLNRRRHEDTRSNDNIATAGIRFAGVCFAIMSGFVIVAIWNANTLHETQVATEVSAASNVFRDAAGLDAASTKQIQSDLKSYLAQVRSEAAGGEPLGVAASATDTTALRRTVFPLMASSDLTVQQVARQLLTDIDALDTASEIRQHGSADPARATIVAAVFILGALCLVLSVIYPRGPSIRVKWIQACAAAISVGIIWGALVVVVDPWSYQTIVTQEIDQLLSEFTASSN